MEKQVSAERERRAIMATSEGDKQSRINRSEGLKAELINISEGEKQRRINEAQGYAQEILSISAATAEFIEKVAEVVNRPGGSAALKLQLSERYIEAIKGLQDARVILPANIVDYRAWLGNLDLGSLVDRPSEGER